MKQAAWRTAWVLAAAGAALILATTLWGGSGAGAFLFALYALLPYAFLLLFGRLVPAPGAAFGAGAAALAVEVGVRLSVFVYPRSSTAAIALVFSPIFITAIVLPLGGVLGFASERLFRRGPVARAGA